MTLDQMEPLLTAINRQALSSMHLSILLFLKKNQGSAMSVVAKEIGFTTAAATGSIDTLERNEYVIRTRDDHDRRKVLVSLTQKGSQAVARFESIIRSLSVN